MATIPKLAGTAAGSSVFVQNFFAGGFAQIYGFVADGDPIPVLEMTALTVTWDLMAAAVSSLLARRKRLGRV